MFSRVSGLHFSASALGVCMFFVFIFILDLRWVFAFVFCFVLILFCIRGFIKLLMVDIDGGSAKFSLRTKASVGSTGCSASS